MSTQEALKSKVDALHAALNELYALDDSWRTLGKWPEGVRGAVLHDRASDDEIARAEVRFGHKFPPSYEDFLRLHSAWEHFWADFTLIGTGRPATQKAQDEIAENIREQTSKLQEKFGGSLSAEAIAGWESKEERNLYLANHLVIGTDFSGAHWVFDTRTRTSNQEMKLTFWDISYGAQDPTFDRFDELLDFAIGEVTFRLEPLKRKKGRGTEQEKTKKTEKTAKRSPKKKSS
jgi:hypothetical protein